ILASDGAYRSLKSSFRLLYALSEQIFYLEVLVPCRWQAQLNSHALDSKESSLSSVHYFPVCVCMRIHTSTQGVLRQHACALSIRAWLQARKTGRHSWQSIVHNNPKEAYEGSRSSGPQHWHQPQTVASLVAASPEVDYLSA